MIKIVLLAVVRVASAGEITATCLRKTESIPPCFIFIAIYRLTQNAKKVNILARIFARMAKKNFQLRTFDKEAPLQGTHIFLRKKPKGQRFRKISVLCFYRKTGGAAF